VVDAAPDVIVELLGGVEPARTLVLEALSRRIPVVTANKSLLARHGDELQQAAHAARVPLRFEASVIAGVPFLDTLARRPLASTLSSLSGIVNGTSNYILSRMSAAAIDYRDALIEAQGLGYAEPDPANDVDGIDAAEKLTVLLRQLTASRLAPDAIETTGISALRASDLSAAHALGGEIKPVVHARLGDAAVEAFAGPAFVPRACPLAAVHHAANSLIIRDRSGREVSFTGPGAGPEVTAATVLDDVVEAMRGGWPPAVERRELAVTPPVTPWFVRLTAPHALPPGAEIADLLGSHGVWSERTSAASSADGAVCRWLLTYPCPTPRLRAALAALRGASGCEARPWRALESSS
jgi:homoserine dehydrogenase